MKAMRPIIDDNKALERAKMIAALRYYASGESCKGCPLGRYDGITCAGFSDMLRKAASLLECDAEPNARKPDGGGE